MDERGGGCGSVLVILAVVGLVSYCAHPGAERNYESEGYALTRSEPDPGDFAADIRADLASSTYSGESYSYGCTDDCSGHEAGWAWAAENGIEATEQCYGNSASFDDGCRTFIEEIERRTEEQMSEHS